MIKKSKAYNIGDFSADEIDRLRIHLKKALKASFDLRCEEKVDELIVKMRDFMFTEEDTWGFNWHTNLNGGALLMLIGQAKLPCKERKKERKRQSFLSVRRIE